MEKISRKGFLKIAAAAAMSGVTAAGLAACNVASSSTAASSGAAGIYTPGTYTATAKGMSEITATVTFDATSITKVELDLSGETDSIGQAAKDKLIEQVLNAQTSQIDGVTGATVTSKAVQNAVAGSGRERYQEHRGLRSAGGGCRFFRYLCCRRCRRGWCQDHPDREVWPRHGQRHP